MDKKQLLKEIAYLESLNDYLSTELNTINDLMRLVGFVDGIKTVKATAQEMLSHGSPHPDDEEID